jgi:predicted Holliday junction resolvase-like endonuclease
MLWFLIIILVLALIYILSEHAMQVRKRKQQLEQIQRRLAEKRTRSSSDTDE